ncbi:MAG: lipid-A-disaccharide synthase [Aminivibrio sp.]
MTGAGGGIFFSCGEVSGDVYAAILGTALRKRGFGGPFFGMGGPQSEEAGAEIVKDSRELHLMGISDVVPAIPRLLKLKRELMELILARGPGAVVLIDSPDFHLPLAEGLRKKGWKGPVISLVPPTVWAWRSGRAKTLRRCFDLCLPLFKFEHDYLRSRAVNSAWRGHPMVDEFRASSPSPAEKIIALLPGSRRSEVFRLLPPLRECAALLRERGYSPVFSIAPGMPADLRKSLRDELGENAVWEGRGRDLMASSLAVAGASGTAAVEAMMLGKYMAVLYKGGFLSWLAWKTLVKTPHISIPNLLAGEEIYPELIQGRARGENVFSALMAYLEDQPFRTRISQLLARAKGAMGQGGTADFWAEQIMELRERAG